MYLLMAHRYRFLPQEGISPVHFTGHVLNLGVDSFLIHRVSLHRGPGVYLIP